MALVKVLALAVLLAVVPHASATCSASLNTVLNGYCLQKCKQPNASVLCKAIVVDVCKQVVLKNVYTTEDIKTYKLTVENKITQNVAMNGNVAGAGATADATGITTYTNTQTNAEADAPLVIDGYMVATGSSTSSSTSAAAASNDPTPVSGRRLLTTYGCSASLNTVLNGYCLQKCKQPNASVLCKAIVVDVCKQVVLKNVYTTEDIKTYKLTVENKITQNVAMNGNVAGAGATADATGITTYTNTQTNAEADAPLVIDGYMVATGSSMSSSTSAAAASNDPTPVSGRRL